jgi:regulator of protease activity HflC (stomatin/prohibitin superfamily)
MNGMSLGRLFVPLTLLLIVVLFAWSSVGTIQTGNVGVRTTLGNVDKSEVTPGVFFRVPIVQTVDEYSAKETAVDLENLTPKAKDNLSLKDLDVSVFYKVSDPAIAELAIKYRGQSVYSSGLWFPAYNLVSSLARGAVYDQVAKLDSLVLHTKREQIEAGVRDALQKELDAADKGVFTITRVVVRAVATDPSIEQSIRNAVAAQKELEQITIQNDIAVKRAQIKVTEARGIAEANRIINSTLTREYLQHEANQVLEEFAKKGNSHTVVIPANSQVAPLINIPAPAPRGK